MKWIPGGRQVKGSHSDEEKEERLEAFGRGQIPILVTKPKIGAWGLNWQHCGHQTFFPSHCYDEATEVLTKRGWLTFGNTSLGDEFATVNQTSLAFEWQYPSNIIWSPYLGPMVHFSSGVEASCAKSFDLLVTPNHKMFVKRCDGRYRHNAGEWMLKDAWELFKGFKRQEYRMLSAPKSFSGTQIESVEIPAYVPTSACSMASVNTSGDRRGMTPSSREALNRRRLKTVPRLSPIQFAQLAGWYLSEGYCGCRDGYYDGQITITQTDVNQDYRKEIIALLNSIPNLTVYDKTKDIRCCSRQLALFLVDQFGAGSRNKRIPQWVKDLDVSILTIIRDTILKGDGCSAGGVKRFYRTTSKQLADDFAEISLKTGIRASIRYRERTTNVLGSDCYDVALAWKHFEPSIHIQPIMVDYCGMVGCATVPNHTLIVRRNGIPAVSGNSFEQYYQAVRRSWRFGRRDPVTVDIVTTEGEAGVTANLSKKQRKADEMFTLLVSEMNNAQRVGVADQHIHDLEIPQWL